MTIYMVTTKIMLNGIAIIKLGIPVIQMTTSKNKIKRHCQDNMGVYRFVSRTKTRDNIATIYNILIIYSSKKDTLGSVETKNIYKCIIMLQ